MFGNFDTTSVLTSAVEKALKYDDCLCARMRSGRSAIATPCAVHCVALVCASAGRARAMATCTQRALSQRVKLLPSGAACPDSRLSLQTYVLRRLVPPAWHNSMHSVRHSALHGLAPLLPLSCAACRHRIWLQRCTGLGHLCAAEPLYVRTVVACMPRAAWLHLLCAALLAVSCCAADNLLIPKPAFALYETLCGSKDIRVKHYNLLPERQWEADLEHLESLIDDRYAPFCCHAIQAVFSMCTCLVVAACRVSFPAVCSTRAILVNNPSNPCGSVYSKEHLEAIIAIAEKV